MGYSQDTNWIYHVIIESINNMFYWNITTNRVVIFEHATYGGSGGILVSWPRDPEDKDQEAQESNPEEPKSNQEQY